MLLLKIILSFWQILDVAFSFVFLWLIKQLFSQKILNKFKYFAVNRIRHRQNIIDLL